MIPGSLWPPCLPDRSTGPMAAGFEAIAVRYGLRFPNDLENIEWQFEVYDALYAWCRFNVVRNES